MDKNYKFKHGDLINFAFTEETCWGPAGVYTAIILYDDEMKKLTVHYLNLKLIRKRIGHTSTTDELENFLEWHDIEDITIIGNLCCRDNINIVNFDD